MIFRYLQSLKITKLYKTEWCLNQKNGRIDTKLYNFTLLFQRYCYNLLFNCFTHLGRWTTLKLYLNRWGTVLARLADAPLNFFINICKFPFLPVWNSLKPPPPPTSFIPTPSAIYYKNNNRSLSSHNPRLFQKPPRIENSEDCHSFSNITEWRERRVTCQQLIGYIKDT